ncbi:MAG: hypothetical protein WCK42_08545 [Myxococcaceae bacterium]
MKKQIKQRRKTISFKDLQIAYLKDGIRSIADLYKKNQISKAAIRRAFDALQQTKSEVTSFKKWIHENLKSGPRGRPTPASGQERSYRAQEVQKGKPFLRLPLNALQIQKGQVISVTFAEDKIIVMPSRT